MERKSWRWRRRSSETTVVENARASFCSESNAEEDQQRAGPRKCPSNVSDRSSTDAAISECSAKDELIRKHARIAEQALVGQRAAIAEATYFKQELDKALQQGEGAEQKLAHLNAALKECMQEIESLQVGQKVTVDFEKEKKKLEGKLAEASKRVGNLSAENANLMKALLCKEKLVQDLDKEKGELEAELSMLMGRLDSAEKESTFLKYEFEVIEKEQELINEERKNNRRSELENAKQIKKLEAECQQLRNLVRKRLQGPIVPMNTKRSNPRIGNSPEKLGKGSTFLTEKVCSLEEENKMLKEILAISDGELQSWRIKYGQMASKVAELKAQLNELSEAENSMQLAISGFGLSNCDEICDSDSWANALLQELEHFRQEKFKNQPEMEKFAIVTSDTEGSGNQLQSTSKELVPISVDNMSCKEEELRRQRDSWLDEILKVILEEHRVSRRNMGELLHDIKIALGYDNLQKNSNNSSEIRGLLTWEPSESIPAENATSASISSNVSAKDGSTAREKLRKQFSFDRLKIEQQKEVDSPNRHNTLAQMIAIQSTVQEENRQVKEKLQSLTEENVALKNQLQESKQTIGSLQGELESLKESKGAVEEQVENQRLINEDLDTQLTVGKGKLNEILHKLSSLEVELEDKNNCCEDLEATCLELQLELETSRLSGKESPGTDTDQVAKKLKSETIQNLAKQIQALPSPDVTQFDEFLSPITTTIPIQKPSVADEKILALQRSTLRDRMMEDDGDQIEGPKILRTKAAENEEEQDEKGWNRNSPEKQSVNDTEFKALPPPPGKVRSLKQDGTLALVPGKKPGGGFGFIRKLFLRRKRGCNKMKAAPLQRNTSASTKQSDVLLVV